MLPKCNGAQRNDSLENSNGSSRFNSSLLSGIAPRPFGRTLKFYGDEKELTTAKVKLIGSNLTR